MSPNVEVDKFACPVHREMHRVAYARRTDRFGRVISEHRPPQLWRDVMTVHLTENAGAMASWAVERVQFLGHRAFYYQEMA